MSSLYIHVPWCRSKCGYCDFFSLVPGAGELDSYVAALLRHLELIARSGADLSPVETLFFGGGTPSLLDASQVGRILEAVRQGMGMAVDAEISLEANPGTLSADSLAGYRRAGVNRLSLGIQSLSDARLRRLGRGHDRRAALRAVELARAAGFANLSLDFIFAQPGQDLAQLQEEAERYLALAPEHISLYGLSLEEGTPLYAAMESGAFELPSDEEYAAQYLLLHRLLGAAGYRHYEISNFARPGRRCRHNLGYWRRRACLAIGAGAHSFLDSGWGLRRACPPDVAAYGTRLARGRDPSEEIETFDRRGAMAETLYLGLRTDEGVCEKIFARRFGSTIEEAWPGAAQALSPWLDRGGGRWRFGVEGWLIYDRLISRFL